ncbi:hypothetical protein JANAI62_23530 [Jannaschia pagri]|uniref:DUF4169 domain-containing protein n=1 Tax=Jannaschia pagri TaxID=2829797 RepID=A0ABQ4NN85_9RHOB|nr:MULTISPECIES: DUF4169 family protein [unclassified Jannaschia]GIT91896.1 hypothetical protein JANAI61_23540 [Jannaschia sp. AI_61]GIT95730.1 hypothetical protein JANAI62_23530 [Jannaschia sp. AI_62]
MTGKIINLNRARKNRARATAKAQADANTVRFGRTKAEKDRQATEAETAERHLDGHRTDGSDSTPPGSDD